MKIAKKNILSSLKAMKGRLFGTRQKPQSENEKNLQSIAREEKSQYSKQQPEIKAKSPGESVPTDAMILRAIGTCEFQFGKELHRVSEAKLEFVYDTGLDLFKIYVIALSEVFGAIMFYIPEDMEEMISRKVATLPDQGFHDYLCHLIEAAAQARHIAEENGVHSYDADAAGAELLEMSRRFSGIGVSTTEAINAMTSLVRAAAHEADRLIETRIRPNNWLKLHGYPMRRKGKGRKRK